MPRLPKFVFPLFLILFFVMAPLVVMYASGYRYDFKKRALSRVGFLLIDGKPKTAEVYLQGAHSGTGLPLYLKQLQPDYYSIEIKNNGYHPLKTNREIKSESSNILSPIFLLKESTPSQVTTVSSKNVWVNSDVSYAFFETATSSPKSDSREFLLYDFAKNSLQSLFTADTSQSFDVQFSQNSNEALITSASFLPHLIHLNNKTITTLNISLEGAVFDPKDNKILYGIIGSSLVSYNLKTSETRTLKSNASAPVIVLDDWIGYGATNIQNKPEFIMISKDVAPSNTPTLLGTLPEGKWTHTIALGSVAEISNENSSYLIFARKGIPEFMRVPTLMTALTEKQDGRTLFLYNQFDINKWNESTHTSELVGRYGGDLTAAAPLHGTDYLIVAAGNDLFAINYSDTSVTPIPLLKNIKITSMFSNKKGTSLYFVGTFEGKTGLFELPMRDE